MGMRIEKKQQQKTHMYTRGRVKKINGNNEKTHYNSH